MEKGNCADSKGGQEMRAVISGKVPASARAVYAANCKAGGYTMQDDFAARIVDFLDGAGRKEIMQLIESGKAAPTSNDVQFSVVITPFQREQLSTLLGVKRVLMREFLTAVVLLGGRDK